jgi:hypothetical protein
VRGSRRRTFFTRRHGGRYLAAESFFFKENATTACDCLLHDLHKPVKQPRQRHFQLNMMVGDINPSGSPLAKS